jgi:hypothetical protein
MKALILSLSLMLSYSCTKYAEFSKGTVGVHIHPVTMEVSHLNEIPWLVGTKKEAKITQSFTFIVDLPKIRQADLDFLTDQKGIDSWIVRLIVNRGSETQDLGSLYALFKPKRVARSSQGTGATTSVTLKVFFAATYASERFRAFKCPAFGHNKRISSMGIKGENDEFSLTVSQSAPYNEKSHLVELTPTAFNAGNSLVGEYFVEIAPYDSKKKLVHSSFKRIPMYVSVEREESVRVRSCDGIHQELQ